MPSGSFCEEDRHYYCSDHVGNTGAEGDINSRCASSLQCTGNWRPFIDQSEKAKYADYVIGGPTIEMWLASWNQKHGTQAEDDRKTLYANGTDRNEKGYYVGENQDCDTSFCDVSETNGYKDTLYFPHREEEDFNLFDLTGTNEKTLGPNVKPDCYEYMLSSPGVGVSGENLLRVHYGGSINKYNYQDYGSGVRPVVCLKLGVTLTSKDGIVGRVVYDINM